MISVLGEDIERATALAKAMSAHPISAHNHGRPWTMHEVLGVALGLGLEDLEKRYLSGGRS